MDLLLDTHAFIWYIAKTFGLVIISKDGFFKEYAVENLR
jgi:PIN domain nuclease of toxin-antitoxin system